MTKPLRALTALLVLALLPARARATSQSGGVNAAQGTFSGTVTAAQFVGGGAGLTNVPVPPFLSITSAAVTGTGSSYNLTLSSSVVFLTAGTGIHWADGSVSTSAFSGGGGGAIIGSSSPWTTSGSVVKLSTPTNTVSIQTSLAVTQAVQASTFTGQAFFGSVNGIFNVKAAPFNATGNGTTDDTAAIQAALAAAAGAPYSTVYFPSGHYKVNGNLHLYNPVNLQGDGYSTQIYNVSTSTDLIDVEGGLYGMEGVHIKDMWLGTAGTTTGISVLRLNTINFSQITNVAFSGGNRGLYVHGCLVNDYTNDKGIDAASDGNFFAAAPVNSGFYFYQDQNPSAIIPESSNSNTYTNISCEGGTGGFYTESGSPLFIGGSCEGSTGKEMVINGVGAVFHAGDIEQGGVSGHVSGLWLQNAHGVSVYDLNVDTFNVQSSYNVSLYGGSIGEVPYVSSDTINYSVMGTIYLFTADAVPLCMGGIYGNGDVLKPCPPNMISFQDYPFNGLLMGGPITLSSATQAGNANAWTFTNLANFGDFDAYTGHLVVQTNIPFGSQFGAVHLVGYEGSTGPMDMTIGFETTSGPGFNDYSYVNSGPLNPTVTLADSGGKVAIILGTNSTTWIVPSLHVVDYLATGSPSSSNGQGWSVSEQTSTTSYTNQVAVPNGTSVVNAQNLIAGPNGTSNLGAPLQSGDGNSQAFYNLAQFGDFASDTGALVIQTNIPMGTRFANVHVHGYTTTNDNGSIDLNVGFGTYSSGDAFRELSVLNSGALKFPVYIGKSAGGFAAILLGTPTSNWVVPSILVDKALVTGTPAASDGVGWSVTLQTSTAAWTNQFLVPDLTFVNHSSYTDLAVQWQTPPNNCTLGNAPTGTDAQGNALNCQTIPGATVGISSTTGTGQTLQNLTISNGVITGAVAYTPSGSSFTGGGVPNTTTFASSVTVTANAFSVGTSTFVVTNGRVSIGSTISLILADIPGSLWGNGNLNFENGAATFAGLTVNGNQILAPDGGTVSIWSDFTVGNSGAVSILASGSAGLTIGQPTTLLTTSTMTFLATGGTTYDVKYATSVIFAPGVPNVGVRWADGTISTTAFSGGGGGTTYSADGVSLSLVGTTFSAQSSSVTLQGNTFNGSNQLVQLNGSGALPAISGANLTGLSSAEGPTYTSTKTFTAEVKFSSGAYFATAGSTITVNRVYVSSAGASTAGVEFVNNTILFNSTPTYANGILPQQIVYLSTGNPSTGSTGIFYSTNTTGIAPRMVITQQWGAGGGGGAADTNPGGSGTATVFGSTSAAFGVGGSSGTAESGTGYSPGGPGGTGVCPTGCDCTNGAHGGDGTVSGNFDNGISGAGGATSRGGAGLTSAPATATTAAYSASPNSGSGGGGGSSNGGNNTGGGGGGAGEYIECSILNPGITSWSYTIGKPGPGGIESSFPTLTGGNGGSGFIRLILIF